MATRKLILGCGDSPRKEGYINLDIRNLPTVDVVRDVLRGLPFDDDSFTLVETENFMEHIPQAEVIFVMNEIWRVLAVGGTAHHHIPLVNTDNDWQDPTHLSRWGVETFKYFERGSKKNLYYGEMIKPWTINSLEADTRAIKVILQK